MKFLTPVKPFTAAFILVLLFGLLPFQVQADEFYRTDKYEYGHDIFSPGNITFLTRATGRRLGDLGGLCSSLVVVDITKGEEQVLDNCVGGSDYNLLQLKEYYLKLLSVAKAEGKRVLLRTDKTWGYDKYDLKILEQR